MKVYESLQHETDERKEREDKYSFAFVRFAWPFQALL